MENRYGTSADGTINFQGMDGKPFRVRLIEVYTQGGLIVTSEVLPSLTVGRLVLDSHKTHVLNVQLHRSLGSFGKGHRHPFALMAGSWPYELFVNLTMMSTGNSSTNSEVPPCLKFLGLQVGCNKDDVDDAYMRLVWEMHPDRGGSVSQFIELQENYREAKTFVGGK